MQIFNFLTPENVNIISLGILIFLCGWELIKILLNTFAKNSKNKYDDKLLALMLKLESKVENVSESDWVKQYAPKVWQIIEQLAATKAPALRGTSKLASGLVVAKEAYEAATQKSLSNDGIKMLETELAKISKEAKSGTPN